MTLTVELPNDWIEREDPAHEALEAVAVQAYRDGSLTATQAAKLLGMGRIAFQEVLIRHGATENFYGVEELEADIRTTDSLHQLRIADR